MSFICNNKIWSFFIEFLSILENPGFLNVQDVLQKQNFGADLNWLQSNTQTELPEAMDADVHSFYVLTGKDKNDYISELPIKKLFKIVNEFKEISAGKNFSDPDAAECYAVAKFSTLFNRQFNKSIEGKPVKTFELEFLDQLNNIAKDLKI